MASGVKNWNDVINDWRATINGLNEPHAYVCEKGSFSALALLISCAITNEPLVPGLISGYQPQFHFSAQPLSKSAHVSWLDGL